MPADGNTPSLPPSRNGWTLQKQASQSHQQPIYAPIGRNKQSSTRKLAPGWVFAITGLLIAILRLGLFDPAIGYTMTDTVADRAALSPCVNSVTGGVYLDENRNNLHESSEPFLAGRIQIFNDTSDVTNLIESTDGLFVLDNIDCGDYAIYHNGDYVGKLVIAEVMGQMRIELPKTNLRMHIFVPFVVR